MLVQQILNSKASDKVFTVPPGTLVSEAAKILAEQRIGTVVVSSEGTDVAGILSERDIVRELARRGAGCLSQSVDDFMTREIVTCTASDTADGVLGKMTEGRFRHMPVMDGERMIGIVTIGDVVKARLTELAMEKDALEGMIMGH